MLTIFGSCEQYTINSLVHFIGNEVAWEIDDRSTSFSRAAEGLLFTSELKNGVHGDPKMKKLNF